MSRLSWIDVLRTFAIVGVLFVHTLSVLLGTSGSVGALSEALIAVALTCVPIFFMVSGALVLPSASKQPLSKYLLIKPISLIALIFIWEFLYRYFELYLNGKQFAFIDVIKAIMAGTPENSILWYLYKITGAYMAAPFVSAMVMACSTRRLVVFVVASLGIDLALRFLNEVFGISWWSPIDYRLYSLWFGYFVAGYLLAHRLSDRYRNQHLFAFLALAGVALTIISNEASQIIRSSGAPMFLGYDELGVVLASVGTFGFCSAYRDKISQWPFLPVYSYVGKLTLGIYMIHIMIIAALRSKFGTELGVFDAALYAFTSGGISLIIAAIMIKIPVLRRTISI